MIGRAGGGFVFDTNGLHRGEVDGSYGRDAVILEFHPHGKVLVKRYALPFPLWQVGGLIAEGRCG